MRLPSISLLFVIFFTSPAFSGPTTQTWWDGFGVTGAGSRGIVRAIIPFNGGLVVGGSFESVGNIKATNVAFWTGTEWQSMGDGVPEGVGELVLYDGTVVAGGESVYEWDGSHWNELGGGTSSTVWALTVYEGKLIAGGFFDLAGGNQVHHIAQWDGNSWQSVGNGFDDWVTQLTVFGDTLAAAGYFGAQSDTNRVATWNGSTWNYLPVSGTGLFLQGSGDSLFIGGDLLRSGGTPERRIAVWNGNNLHSMGPALDFSPSTLQFLGNQLYLGGSYRIDPFLFNYRLVKWDGNDWIPQITDALGYILDLEEFQNELVIGGSIVTVEGKLMNGISRKEGNNWLSFGPGSGMSDYIGAFAELDGALVAGGRFRFAGQTRVNGVAQWDGQTWHPFGLGMSSSVQALVSFSNGLVAGGEFTYADGMAALHVAEWDGTGWSHLGDGFDNYVWALDVFNDSLYAGGKFTKSGNLDVTGLSKWDGQNWTALPPLTDPITWSHPSVKALLNHGTNTELIVAGDFKTAGGLTVNHIARWNGTSWSAMGEGFNNTVEDICEFKGDVIACGWFTTSGTGAGSVTVNGIAKWNGTFWEPLGSGFIGPGLVISDVAEFQGALVASGYISCADSCYQTFAAYWDGQFWNPLAELEGLEVKATHAMGNSLFFGGSFSAVNGIPAYNIARLDGLDLVPVKSLHFEANRTSGGAMLEWDVAGSLEDLAAFRLDRRVGNGEPMALAVIPISGSNHFEYVDKAPPAEKTGYHLWGLDRGGAATLMGSTLLLPATTTPRLVLLQSSPNPSRGATAITLRSREQTRASLRIIDSSGREVIQLLSGPIQAGETRLSWNGQDRLGHPVPSGIYYYQLDTPFEQVAMRLVLVK